MMWLRYEFALFRLLQSILAAVLSAVLGTKDPDQVSTMAKQAGEVWRHILQTYH